ncbi:MAG: hypothetical protein KR126chlam2_00693 [Chlamydiae bacterium]|nr:hypothetical protein [Chlamydiota bacterium]
MKKLLSLLLVLMPLTVLAHDVNIYDSYYITWHRYKANFGVEKTFVEFPNRPTETQTNFLKIAYTWDSNILYSFSGYFPPMGNLNPRDFFDNMLCRASDYPYVVLSSAIYEDGDGYWVLDYSSKDMSKNTIVYTRSVVSPFNAYILQAVFPYGYTHHFEYFIDTFKIRCDCDK